MIIEEVSSVEVPVSETPATETPVSEVPVTETPASEAPASETPVTDTPVTETPVTNEIVVPGAHQHNKIILMLMIKNESRIIQRCIMHAIQHVDAVCVLDTGSTDNTVEICTSVLKCTGKPFKIGVEPFINFGKSRTASFRLAQAFCTELGWPVNTTYALAVDADMNLVVKPGFASFKLSVNGYTVIQANGHMKYHNTRIMRIGSPWKCTGATHEYWDLGGTQKIPFEIMYIDDKNDGGCKSDKFERDVRLLREEIAENPKNDRAHYYLGQSLKDLGRFDEAIEMFKRRIEIGGWVEEVHYSYYQIGKCYDHMNKPLEMELWMNKAFEFYPKKAEPLYHLTRYFRERSQHFKAYHYYLKGRDIPYPKDDVLFIENHVYEGLFHYEATILDCYVVGRSKQDSLGDLIGYINRNVPHFVQNVWDNMVYYVEPLACPMYRGSYTKLLMKDSEEYKASSCALLPYSNDAMRKYVMNVRYVNYEITPGGKYIMRCPKKNVKTRNGRIFLNASYQPTEEVTMMTENYTRYDRNIEGLEDVRVFHHNGRLHFTASSKNATNDENIVIVCGEYDELSCKMGQTSIIASPRGSECEKNWIYVPNSAITHEAGKDAMNFVYGWSPFEIGVVKNGTLMIHTTYQTCQLFTHARGSSSLVEYDGKLWGVVHYVKYVTPRIYSHSVVQFNRDTMRPEQYTLPFCFRNNRIEYCLGFDIRNDICCFAFSENDSTPGMIHVPMQNLRFLSF
jgi:tetratricopeptide (TPR) repeat protein